jgi:hypothetical protein
VVAHYKQVFGGLDYRIKIGGVEFVFVDAQVLDGEACPISLVVLNCFPSDGSFCFHIPSNCFHALITWQEVYVSKSRSRELSD